MERGDDAAWSDWQAALNRPGLQNQRVHQQVCESSPLRYVHEWISHLLSSQQANELVAKGIKELGTGKVVAANDGGADQSALHDNESSFYAGAAEP